jgi:hypothetical protein
VSRNGQKEVKADVYEANLTVSGVLIDIIDDIGSNFFPDRGIKRSRAYPLKKLSTRRYTFIPLVYLMFNDSRDSSPQN